MSALRPAAAAAFQRLTASHEGVVPWLYLDSLGLVTTAIGNMVDQGQKSAVYAMAWKCGATGLLCTRAQIDEAWNAVKARQDLKGTGGGSHAFAALTSIRLGPADAKVGEVTPEIQAVWDQATGGDVALLARTYPAFPAWPADVQVALMRHSWAGGVPTPTNGWPLMGGALLRGDFVGAAQNETLKSVDAAYLASIRAMLLNGADVVAGEDDPSVFYWPGSPPSSGGQEKPPTAGALAQLAPWLLAIGGGVALYRLAGAQRRRAPA